MTMDEALEAAEEMLFGDLPMIGEPGWRVYTPQERQKLKLATYTIWSEATGKMPFSVNPKPWLKER